MRQIIVLFLMITGFSMNAQNGILHEAKMTVISPRGISVYSRPDLKSKKISSFPFGAEIKIEFNREVKVDTIGSHKCWKKSCSGSYDIHIIGSWRKLKDATITGYVFDAYLGGKVYLCNRFKGEELNKSHIILFPGSNCENNFNYNPNMNWFGFYLIENQIIVKPVDVIFFNRGSAMSNKSICANDYENLRFIYGTEADLNSVTPDYGNYTDDYISKKSDNYPELSGRSGRIIIKKNGKTQNLSSSHGYANFIKWRGDLDNDGQEDYIISFGEVGGFYMLFLSSEAKGDEIVRPASVFSAPYCC